MKKIQKLADQMCEEIQSAQDYAECYLDYKAKGNSTWASKYKGMAEDELKHAMIIHDRTVEEIGVLSKVYTPPVEMEEKWNQEHKKYVEKAAFVKMLLAM